MEFVIIILFITIVILLFFTTKRNNKSSFYRDTIPKIRKISFEEKQVLVENSEIIAKNLLNKQETEIYKELIRNKNITSKFTIFSQVSMKAFIESKLELDSVWKAYRDYYVDFLLVSRNFNNNIMMPIAVIEYHGGGHYGKENSSDEHKNNVKNNDEIKRQILEKANINLFIILADDICTKKENDRFPRIDNIKLKEEIEYISKTLEKRLNKS